MRKEIKEIKREEKLEEMRREEREKVDYRCSLSQPVPVRFKRRSPNFNIRA